MPRYACVAVLLALAGCAGAPTRYLALAPVPGPPAAARETAPLAVAHVQMPAALDRLRLTRATGPETVAVAPETEWIAPLDGMAQQVLARDLAARLPGTDVVMPGDPLPAGRMHLVRVNVLRFMPVDTGSGAGQVVLDADWALTERNGEAVLASGQARLTVPAGHGGAAQAAAMSTALGRLADRIAAGTGRG